MGEISVESDEKLFIAVHAPGDLLFSYKIIESLREGIYLSAITS